MRWFSTFLLIFLSRSLVAQELSQIKLAKCISNYPFKESLVGTEIINEINDYKIPNQLKDFIIKKYSIRNRFNIDRFNFMNDVNRDFISVLININPDSSRTVIIDTNNDIDFTNDKSIVYSKIKSVNEDFFVVQLSYKTELINFYFQAFTYPKNLTYNIKTEQDHYLIIRSFETYSGILKIDNNKYQIYIKNNFSTPYYHKSNIEISVKDSLGNYKFYNSNEAIDIKGNKILIDSISITGDKLFVKTFKKDVNFHEYGFTKDFYLAPFNILDFNQKNLELPVNNKYTLIDFWGTWCAPCKELTPKLVAMNQKFKKKISMISIAGISKLNDVREYAYKHNMDWTQIVDEGNNKRLFSNEMFNVNEYPTFILIDQTGKIVSKGTGAKALVEIEAILDK